MLKLAGRPPPPVDEKSNGPLAPTVSFTIVMSPVGKTSVTLSDRSWFPRFGRSSLDFAGGSVRCQPFSRMWYGDPGIVPAPPAVPSAPQSAVRAMWPPQARTAVVSFAPGYRF